MVRNKLKTLNHQADHSQLCMSRRPSYDSPWHKISLYFRASLTAVCELLVSTTEATPRLLKPERVTVGNATDVIVELRCYSATESGPESSSTINWEFAANNTAVSSPLAMFGTSQGDGVLRVAPSYLLSTNGTVFICKDTKNDDALKVTLELRKLTIY